MILLTLLWVLTAVAEGMLYADRPVVTLRLRRWLLRAALGVGLVVTVLLVVADWRIWLVPAVLELYRLVNGARFLRQRLSLPRLNSVALRAHYWLATLQAVAAVASWLIVELDGGAVALAAMAVLQLVGTLVLLRSSLHTWRHTQPVTRAEPLADRELPALSVLVPARNETDALQRCLEQLVASDYPKLEIIVFDDSSANRRTPEIIRGFAHSGVRFIPGKESMGARWLAKNSAYEQLRQEASGELLLFCGVDALFQPQSLRRLVEVLEYRQKDMLSVLPEKDPSVRRSISLLQPMRYYWELCLPRRFFKRPPVLSTCWLIRKIALERAGSFAAVSRSVTPEAYFARQSVVTDGYSFIRSDSGLGIYSAKPVSEQYDTSVRMRYPQLHRRLELVAVMSLLELVALVGPVVGLMLSGLLPRPVAYAFIWAVCTGCLLATYYLAAVSTGLNNPLLAWLQMPFAFAYDIVMLHISLYKYEFSHVEWKGRDVVPQVMQVIPHLPKL